MQRVTNFFIFPNTDYFLQASIWSALFFVAQLAFPLAIVAPLLGISVLLLALNYFFNPKIRAEISISNALRVIPTFFALWIAAIPVLIAFLFSDRIYVFALRDVINIFAFVGLAGIWFTLVKSKADYKRFEKMLMQGFVVLAYVAAILGFVKFQSSIHSWLSLPLLLKFSYVDGTPLKADYNNYALFLFFALWFKWHLARERPLSWQDVAGTILLLSAIIFSASRRGFLVIGIMAAICFVSVLVSLFYRKSKQVGNSSNQSPYRATIEYFSQARAYAVSYLICYGLVILTLLVLSSESAAFRLSNYVREYGYRSKPLVTQLINISSRYVTISQLGFLPMGDLLQQKSVSRRWEKLKEVIRKEESSKEVAPEVSRYARWTFGMKLFIENYSWKEKIFGSGFDYLRLFADEFSKRYYRPGLGYSPRYYEDFRYHEDYPHNFVISSLLYSGIIGTLLLLPFCCLLVGEAFRLVKSVNPFLFLSLISFVYALSSGNSIFSSSLFVMVYFLFLFRARFNKTLQVSVSSEPANTEDRRLICSPRNSFALR